MDLVEGIMLELSGKDKRCGFLKKLRKDDVFGAKRSKEEKEGKGNYILG
jgi:hypothetical protein